MKRCIWSRVWTAGFIAGGLALLLIFAAAHAQEIRIDGLREANAAHRQRVTVDSDKFTVAAGRPDWIELTFHVDLGFHINSHEPRDETLIPTALKLAPSGRVQVLQDTYPAGLPMHLSVGAGQTLSTYAGEFRVRVKLVADKGDSVLAGALHYQACDAASCYPPRDLPVSVEISAR